MAVAGQYSLLDRAVHGMAFHSLEVQKGVAEIESLLFRRRLADVTLRNPIFITSLPRAGTTLLLDVLSSLQGFASHTYRDMPFVLCPLIWSALSRNFRRRGGERARAHGDGMVVGYDSPEAFEEVVWQGFWPDQYHSDHIDLWDTQATLSEFEEFFRDHVRKIIALRKGGETIRYVSKNNANIARIGYLSRLFPDCVIVVPFRSPLDHAGSLLRQHHSFLEIHARNDFAKRYMAWIGHFEFGQLLRPIDFKKQLCTLQAHSPEGLDYWLCYWNSAFEWLLENRTSNIRLISYERLCGDPYGALARLGREIGLNDLAPILVWSDRIRTPSSYKFADCEYDFSVLEAARATHQQLCEVAII